MHDASTRPCRLSEHRRELRARHIITSPAR
jgi:hypothetical protein